jgi:hypothetical protein
MNSKLDTEPQYQELIEALIEKTREGKINWEETAQPNTYIAAVKGERTFEIAGKLGQFATVHTGGIAGDGYRGKVPLEGGMVEKTIYRLTVKDKDGKEVLSTPDYSINSIDSARKLYELAKRLAERVDERIDTTLELIRTL